MCSSLGLLTTGIGRKPSGIVTVLLKKYWPGLYRAVSDGPDGPKKLALKWDDYHAAPCGVMTTTTEDGRRVAPTCAQVVLRTFWEFYKLSSGMDHQEATAVLEKMAKKNLRDALYHVRKLAITHYFAEKGKRKNKDRVIAENLIIEDDAGWQSICPTWCVNKKDGWCALVRYWTDDEEFKARSIQNKANRGSGGTHNQGNKPFPLYEKDMVAANGGQEIPRIQVWQAAHKKKELVEGKVVYYGKTEESVDSYKKAFKSLHGEDSDPLSEPFDEMAVMISGHGKPHGRTSILNEALFAALTAGAPPPQYVEPPVVPQLPKMPTKAEFLAQFHCGTPGSSTHSNNPFGRAAASSPDASPAERTLLHFGGPSPGHSAGVSPRRESRESRQHSPQL
ncbi:hypothetical protein ACQ4PT_059769 [Festuca glaucescens]